jgi:GAF domain-containing protein
VSETRGNNTTPEGPSAMAEAAALLERAQLALRKVDLDSVRLSSEFSARIEVLERNLSEMESLLIRTERQAAQLANLYVATYQLHASLDLREVRTAVADIATNLLGAEHFTLVVRGEDGKLARAPESITGSDVDAFDAVELTRDPVVAKSLTHSSVHFGPEPGSRVLVAVPLVAQGELVGILALERLLAHKPGLNPEDRELLDLLAAHAASALLAARAFHVAQRKLDTYQGLLGLLRKGA